MRYVNNMQNNKLAMLTRSLKLIRNVHSASDDRTETEEHNACVTVRKFVNSARDCTEYILFSHANLSSIDRIPLRSRWRDGVNQPIGFAVENRIATRPKQISDKKIKRP
jgi:hypothetical protein